MKIKNSICLSLTVVTAAIFTSNAMADDDDAYSSESMFKAQLSAAPVINSYSGSAGHAMNGGGEVGLHLSTYFPADRYEHSSEGPYLHAKFGMTASGQWYGNAALGYDPKPDGEIHGTGSMWGDCSTISTCGFGLAGGIKFPTDKHGAVSIQVVGGSNFDSSNPINSTQTYNSSGFQWLAGARLGIDQSWLGGMLTLKGQLEADATIDGGCGASDAVNVNSSIEQGVGALIKGEASFIYRPIAGLGFGPFVEFEAQDYKMTVERNSMTYTAGASSVNMNTTETPAAKWVTQDATAGVRAIVYFQ
jgi:hypothetical protein